MRSVQTEFRNLLRENSMLFQEVIINLNVVAAKSQRQNWKEDAALKMKTVWRQKLERLNCTLRSESQKKHDSNCTGKMESIIHSLAHDGLVIVQWIEECLPAHIHHNRVLSKVPLHKMRK